VTDRQRFAYEHPCARADETIDQRFASLDPPWFTVLTVNK
jgi:hypothetical protein